MYQTAKADAITGGQGALDRTSTFLGVKYVNGAHTLMAQAGQAKLDASNQTSTATYQVEGQKSKVTGLGYDYALSKRTSLYARYENIDDKAGMVSARATIDGTSTKITRTALGVRHTF